MPIVALPGLLQPAFKARYGVPAFNIINDLTMDAVLSAAARAGSPVIVQVSVKTVKRYTPRLLRIMFEEMVSTYNTVATLHLDHCSDPALVQACFAAGWNSALFDTGHLPYPEALEQTRNQVELAQSYGAHIEGELEPIRGVEDDHSGHAQDTHIAVDACRAFVQETGICCFGPDIGTAHGLYTGEPVLDYARLDALVGEVAVPMVLHGGTGLAPAVLQRLVAAGIAKVNISTMLKLTFINGVRRSLNQVPDVADPFALLNDVHADVQAMVARYIDVLGSGGKVS